MKVAVFGGSGFLGLYLAKELLRKKYHVCIFDIAEVNYQHEALSFEKTDILIEKSVNTVVDLLDTKPLESLLDLGKFLWKEKM